MLILARRINQTVMIEHEPLTVVGIGKDYVRVCFKGKALRVSLQSELELTESCSVWLTEAFKSTAKLAFDAPPEVAIHRSEIYNRIKQEQAA